MLDDAYNIMGETPPSVQFSDAYDIMGAPSSQQPAQAKPRTESGFFAKLKKKSTEIVHGAKDAYDEIKAGGSGWIDASVGAIDELAKPASMFGAVMTSGLTNAGNKLGLVSDETNTGVQEDMYRRLTGGTMTSDAGLARQFEESQQTAAGKAGKVTGAVGGMVLQGGGLASLGKNVVGLAPRTLLRAGQGVALGAPGTVERALQPNSTFSDIAKKIASDAVMGGMFSNRVNKLFDGKTAMRVVGGAGAKALGIGGAQAAVQAAAGDDGTFIERFGEALPESVGTMAAMELGMAPGRARAKSIENRAASEWAAREEANRPQRELDSQVDRYHELSAELEVLNAKQNMGIKQLKTGEGTGEQVELAGYEKPLSAAELALGKQPKPNPVQADLERIQSELNAVKQDLSAKGIEPWLTPADPTAVEPSLFNGPDPVELTAQNRAAEAQAAQMDPLNTPQPQAIVTRGGPVEMGPPMPSAPDPYANPQPPLKPKVTGPAKDGRAVDDLLSGRQGEPAQPTDTEGLQYLNAGLNVKQILGEWWKGKGQEGSIKTKDGKDVFYTVDAQGQIQFHTDSKGAPLPGHTVSGHKFWTEELNESERAQVLKLAQTPNGVAPNEKIAKGLLLASTPGGLHPDVEALAPFKQLREDFHGTWAPGELNKTASDTRDIARQRMAERVFEQGRLARSIEVDRKAHENASLADYNRVMDYADGHGGKLTPSEQAAYDKLRPELDRRGKEMADLGILKEGQLVDDYLGRSYQQESGEGALMRDSNRPLEGQKSFAKNRVFDTAREGALAGYLPESTNFVETQLWKMRQMDKAIAGRKIMNELVENGTAMKADAPNIPKDYIPVKGLGAEYYVEPGSAKVLNNMLSKGFRGNKFYDTLATVNNAMNQAQLGGSGFHGGFVAMDSGVSKLASAGKKFAEAIKSGDTSYAADGMKDLFSAGTIIGPAVENTYKGLKILKDIKSGVISDTTKLALEGGMHYEMDPMYKSGSIDKFKQNIRDAKLAKNAGAVGKLAWASTKALVNTPLAGLELAFKPIGEYFVPAVKAAAVHDLLTFELKRLGPNATLAERRATARKVVDSIDNRMGQLAYDNLMWNRGAKDISHLLVRSVGWNLGTARELGGGARDLVTKLPKGELTHSASYTLALPIMTAWAGIVYQFLKTGKYDFDEVDKKTLMGMPKTGVTAPTGEEERDQMPGYMGDVWKVSRHPVSTVMHKTGPMVNAAAQLVQNKDFYGNQIYDKTADAGDIVKQVGKYAGSQMTPFFAKNAEKITKEHGADPVRIGTTFVGINPAPAWVNKTDAENMMGEFIGAKGPIGGRDYRSAEKKDSKNEITNLANKARSGDLKAMAQLKEMANTRDLQKEMVNIGKQSPAVRAQRDTKSFRMLTLPQARRVFEVATPEERNVWKDILRVKAMRYNASQDKNNADDKAYEAVKKMLGM